MIDKTDIQRIATAAVGALVLSTACVLSAAGPVRAAEPQAQTATIACTGPIAFAR